MTDYTDPAAKQANAANQLAPLAELADTPDQPERGPDGRFLTGNNGGRRPKGSRNRLSEAFLSALASDFQENGAEAIEALRRTDPKAYLQIIAVVTAKVPLAEINVQNNTHVDRSKVMVVVDHGSDEEWEAKLRRQQRSLIEEAKPKTDAPSER